MNKKKIKKLDVFIDDKVLNVEWIGLDDKYKLSTIPKHLLTVDNLNSCTNDWNVVCYYSKDIDVVNKSELSESEIVNKIMNIKKEII